MISKRTLALVLMIFLQTISSTTAYAAEIGKNDKYITMYVVNEVDCPNENNLTNDIMYAPETKYSYNKEGLLSDVTISNYYSLRFKYKEGHVVKSVEKANSTIEKCEWFYNKKGNIHLKQIYVYKGKSSGKIKKDVTYYYGKNNMPRKVVYRGVYNISPIERRYYYDKKNLVTKYTQKFVNIGEYDIEYGYDKHKNIIEENAIRTYDYKYNKKGYPVQKFAYINGDDDNPTNVGNPILVNFKYTKMKVPKEYEHTIKQQQWEIINNYSGCALYLDIML